MHLVDAMWWDAFRLGMLAGMLHAVAVLVVVLGTLAFIGAVRPAQRG